MSNWHWCFIKISVFYYVFLTNYQIFITNTFRLIETFRLSYDWWSRKLHINLTTRLSDKINIPIQFVQYQDLFLLCWRFYVSLPVWRKWLLFNPCSSFWCRLGGRSHSETRFRHPACLPACLPALGKLESACNPGKERNFTLAVVLNTWLA